MVSRSGEERRDGAGQDEWNELEWSNIEALLRSHGAVFKEREEYITGVPGATCQVLRAGCYVLRATCCVLGAACWGAVLRAACV